MPTAVPLTIWRAAFIMYHGALVIRLNVIDRKACIKRMFAGLAWSQIWMPYDNTGLGFGFYSISLLLQNTDKIAELYIFLCYKDFKYKMLCCTFFILSNVLFFTLTVVFNI